MALDVSVVIGSFGDRKWEHLSRTRAIPSANQFGVPVLYNHGPTLHLARNMGLDAVKTEWVCHLDSDDELEPGFFDEIEKVEGDVRAPSVRYVTGGSGRYRHGARPHPSPARMPHVAGHSHDCVAACLEVGNWLVVGSVARTELLLKVGGWRDYPVYEDYDLWMRCWIAGASIVPAPKAVYRAHRNGAGRNNSMSTQKRRLVHYEISKTNMPDRNWEWLRS